MEQVKDFIHLLFNFHKLLILFMSSLQLLTRSNGENRIKNGTILTMAGSVPEIIEGSLGIEGDRIAYVGRDLRSLHLIKLLTPHVKLLCPGL